MDGSTSNCKYLANKISKQNTIRFLWVPGHQNIAGNEKVDYLAKDAITLNVNPNTIPLTPILDAIKTTAKEITDNPTDNRQPWFYKTEMTRRDISTINNIKLNQSLTPKFLYQCKYQETPLIKSMWGSWYN